MAILLNLVKYFTISSPCVMLFYVNMCVNSIHVTDVVSSHDLIY